MAARVAQGWVLRVYPGEGVGAAEEAWVRGVRERVGEAVAVKAERAQGVGAMGAAIHNIKETAW